MYFTIFFNENYYATFWYTLLFHNAFGTQTPLRKEKREVFSSLKYSFKKRIPLFFPSLKGVHVPNGLWKSRVYQNIAIIFRWSKRFPLTTSIFGMLNQLLAFGMIIIPKLIVISTALIHTPFVYILGMMIELVMIVTLNFCLYKNIKGIYWDENGTYEMWALRLCVWEMNPYQI